VYLTLCEIYSEKIIRIEQEFKKEKPSSIDERRKQFEVREDLIKDFKKYFQQAFTKFMDFLAIRVDNPSNLESCFDIESEHIDKNTKFQIEFCKLRIQIQLIQMSVLMNVPKLSQSESRQFCRSTILSFKHVISASLSSVYRFYNELNMGLDYDPEISIFEI
jgi:hypothetical protein